MDVQNSNRLMHQTHLYLVELREQIIIDSIVYSSQFCAHKHHKYTCTDILTHKALLNCTFITLALQT